MLYSGITALGPAHALKSVSGVPVWINILVIMTICTIYTSIVRHKIFINILNIRDVIRVVVGVHVYACTCIGTIVRVLFVAQGGIKAVIWTDVFQAFIMLAGLVAVIVVVTR